MKTATNSQHTAQRPTLSHYTEQPARATAHREPANGLRATDYNDNGITINKDITTGERVYILLSSFIMAIGVVCGAGLLLF